jgi:hypothetical protein
MKLATLGIVSFVTLGLAAGAASASLTSAPRDSYDAGATGTRGGSAQVAPFYDAGTLARASSALGTPASAGYDAGAAAWDSGAR